MYLIFPLILGIGVLGGPISAYADEIIISSYSLEDTTIIVIENNSKDEINTFRMWLGDEYTFESLKTEKGWVGEINTSGVIIFKSPKPLGPGESVKFGIKTDTNTPGINWKALDKESETLARGKVLPGAIPKVEKIETPTENQNVPVTSSVTASITSDSTFRTVPQNPTIGNSFRLTGEKFGASQDFDFYLDSSKIGSFVTDKDGNFITTFKIPDNINAGRVDFKIKDNENKEKSISLRIEKVQEREEIVEKVKLTISGIPTVLHRGDFIEISGTGDPNSTIISTVTDEQGNIYATRTTQINSKGDWKLTEPIIIPLDIPFGKYSAIITDGREDILKNWSIESDKTIVIIPTTLKFEKGEIMTFEGTVSPNIPLEIAINNPVGKEIFSNIYQIDDSGVINFEYEIKTSDIEGTYSIIAIQDDVKEFTFTGVGELPTIPVYLEFDKTNYKTNEIAHIVLSGSIGDIVSLLLINPSDQPIGNAISITLEANGKATYDLDLKGYGTGIYSAVVSKGGIQSSEIFAVGLQSGAGEIEINTTKNDYLLGENILILGEMDENSILTIRLINTDEKIIKESEIFSDKDGKISDSSFRIPTDGEIGTWSIHAKSGSSFDIKEIQVIPEIDGEMIVTVEEGEVYGGVGKSIIFQVVGAQQKVDIEIIAEDGEIIDTLSFSPTSQGEIRQPWIIPSGTAPGTYTIKVINDYGTQQTDFEIK